MPRAFAIGSACGFVGAVPGSVIQLAGYRSGDWTGGLFVIAAARGQQHGYTAECQDGGKHLHFKLFHLVIELLVVFSKIMLQKYGKKPEVQNFRLLFSLFSVLSLFTLS
jgi:hypothetical protein